MPVTQAVLRRRRTTRAPLHTNVASFERRESCLKRHSRSAHPSEQHRHRCTRLHRSRLPKRKPASRSPGRQCGFHHQTPGDTRAARRPALSPGDLSCRVPNSAVRIQPDLFRMAPSVGKQSGRAGGQGTLGRGHSENMLCSKYVFFAAHWPHSEQAPNPGKSHVGPSAGPKRFRNQMSCRNSLTDVEFWSMSSHCLLPNASFFCHKYILRDVAKTLGLGAASVAATQHISLKLS